MSNPTAEDFKGHTPEQLFEKMIDIMPYRLPLGSRPYIIEAIETYSATTNQQLRERVKELEEALRDAKETIKNWYGISGSKYWDFYDDKSLEMQRINSVLAKVALEGGREG